MQVMASLCPFHSNGDAAHNNDFAFSLLMDLVKAVLKVLDRVESEDKKGRVVI